MIARSWWIAVALTAGAASAAPAAASTASDVGAGQRLDRQLRAGQTTCARVDKAEFAQLGEFVMNGLAGSPASHDGLNTRMASVMGAANERRMHVLMGQQYAGCSAAAAGEGTMMGGGPTSPGAAVVAPTTDQRGWGWMRSDGWRQMNRADWRAVAGQWMGPSMMAFPASGTGPLERAGVVAAIALVIFGGLSGLLLLRRRRRVPDGAL